MKATDPHNAKALGRQLITQRNLAWDLEEDIPWDWGIDLGRFFLPLDDKSLAFPGASAEQELALSQYMGLVVNATISEMEDSLPKLKYHGWERVLRLYPANPELVQLGEMFFEEEAKHAKAFKRFLVQFCDEAGIDFHDLDSLLPKAYGSFFQKSITKNAASGGHAFWWVVSMVEEVSIAIYHEIFRHKDAIDPLFFQLHRLHLEEESRHANYAYLMLNIAKDRPQNLREMMHRKVDYLLAQVVGSPWVVAELYKFFNVRRLKGVHPFFDVLHSCIPLFESMSRSELISRMFLAAPYISWLLNPNWRGRVFQQARSQGALLFPKMAYNGSETKILNPRTGKIKVDDVS